ncbi:MAG: hypothetical protein ACR2ON_00305 [Paracoccaceae bacterium]
MQDPFKLFKKWRKGAALDKVRKGKQKPKPKKDKAQDSEKNKVIRRLKHRTEYLVEEEKYVGELRQKAKANFHTAIALYCQENPKATNPLAPIAKKNENTKQEKVELPEEMKLLYREIAKMTHPDKQHEDPEAMVEIFLEATAAKDENKIEELINISFGLDLDISEISMDLVEEIEDNLNKKEKRIVELRSDAAITWFQSPKDIQEKIIRQICPLPKAQDEEKKD